MRNQDHRTGGGSLPGGLDRLAIYPDLESLAVPKTSLKFVNLSKLTSLTFRKACILFLVETTKLVWLEDRDCSPED